MGTDVLAWIFATLLGGIGAIMVIYGGIYGFKSALKRWNRTEAVIHDVQFSPVAGETAELVILEYRYTVDDMPHISRQIVYESPIPLSPEHRTFILNYYPIGKSVTVYYRSDAPHRAQLERDTDDVLFFVFLLIGAGLVLLILANGWIQSLNSARS